MKIVIVITVSVIVIKSIIIIIIITIIIIIIIKCSGRTIEQYLLASSKHVSYVCSYTTV